MKSFHADSGGATAIEYTLIATVISVLIVTAMTQIGVKVVAFFTSILAGFH